MNFKSHCDLLVISIIGTLLVTEMTVKMVFPQMLPQIILIVEPRVTKFAEWVPFVRLVISIAYTTVQGKVFTAVKLPLEWKYLEEKI